MYHFLSSPLLPPFHSSRRRLMSAPALLGIMMMLLLMMMIQAANGRGLDRRFAMSLPELLRHEANAVGDGATTAAIFAGESRQRRQHHRQLQQQQHVHYWCDFDELIASKCDLQTYCKTLEGDGVCSPDWSVTCLGSVESGWVESYDWDFCQDTISRKILYDETTFDPSKDVCYSDSFQNTFGPNGVFQSSTMINSQITRPEKKKGSISYSTNFEVCQDWDSATFVYTFGDTDYCASGSWFDVKINGMACNDQSPVDDCFSHDCSNIDPLLAFDDCSDVPNYWDWQDKLLFYFSTTTAATPSTSAGLSTSSRSWMHTYPLTSGIAAGVALLLLLF